MDADYINNNKNIYFASLKGKREKNEDAEVVIENIDGSNSKIHNINCFCIMDGHGSNLISHYLKNVLPDYFLNTQVKYPLSKTYVMNVYDTLQKSLEKQPYTKKAGSTALAVFQFKQNNSTYLNIINLGDCRSIICRDNLAIPLTKDHKPNWPEEKGRIKSLGGEIDFDGYDWRIGDLSVSRAFGDVDTKPFISHLPDLYRYKLDKGDKFFILGCDGLYDYLSNSDIVNYILNNCYDDTTNIRINKDINIAKKLAEYAIQSGSGDNISIILVFLD